jgi:hypothetical protein
VRTCGRCTVTAEHDAVVSHSLQHGCARKPSFTCCYCSHSHHHKECAVPHAGSNVQRRSYPASNSNPDTLRLSQAGYGSKQDERCIRIDMMQCRCAQLGAGTAKIWRHKQQHRHLSTCTTVKDGHMMLLYGSNTEGRYLNYTHVYAHLTDQSYVQRCALKWYATASNNRNDAKQRFNSSKINV